ncbi:hypothetical protein M9Y10_032379 [Tritrichomonas musculus]|uniref:Uncharacterized protein n=1 Tax=Tritrichomonas musculus TaxID=1915356 RepID=A0ABR2GYC2_9EUKA
MTTTATMTAIAITTSIFIPFVFPCSFGAGPDACAVLDSEITKVISGKTAVVC